MPDYDVCVTTLVKIKFNAGNNTFAEKLIVYGNKAEPEKAPVISEDVVFNGWYGWWHRDRCLACYCQNGS